jgi:hypothetical protein
MVNLVEGVYLESLVLEDTLDGSIFARRGQLGLEDNTERTVAYDLALRVLQVSGFACDAVLYFLADNFYTNTQPLWRRDHWMSRASGVGLPPMRRELNEAFGREELILKGIHSLVRI